MEGPVFVQQVIDRLCAFSAVDNAQGLFLPVDLLCRGLPGQFSLPPEDDAPECLPMEHRTQLCGGPVRQKFPEYSVQRRLCGGTKHSRNAVILHQLSDCKDAGTKIGDRHHLRLVKDDNAFSQIVQLAALGGATGKERFKKLHCRSHHHRHIPVFGGSGQSGVLRPGLVLYVIENAGVMLQHIFISQNFPEDLGILLDDGGIRDDIDNPAQSVGAGVAQGKGQGRHGFAAAGGDGQGKEPRTLALSLFYAMLQNLTAFPVQFRFWRKPAGDIRLEFILQYLHRVSSAALPFPSCHKCLCVQEICVYQAGIKHSGKKHLLQRT